MDREMRNDGGEVVAREAEGPGYASGEAVVATGTQSLDEALHRQRGNFTIEGRGEEIPAPPQRQVEPFVLPETRNETERLLREARREMADATGEFMSANDVLLNQRTLPTHDEAEEIMRDLLQEETRRNHERRRQELDRQVDETLANIREAPMIEPAVTTTQADATTWTLTTDTGTGTVWTPAQLGEFVIHPTPAVDPLLQAVETRSYYCPQCDQNVTSTFKIALNHDERGGEHEYRWCAKCLCRALHQLVPLVRPARET